MEMLLLDNLKEMSKYLESHCILLITNINNDQ